MNRDRVDDEPEDDEMKDREKWINEIKERLSRSRGNKSSDVDRPINEVTLSSTFGTSYFSSDGDHRMIERALNHVSDGESTLKEDGLKSGPFQAEEAVRRFYSEHYSGRQLEENTTTNNDLGSHPPELQEYKLMNDVVYMLYGHDGDYIHLRKAAHKYERRTVYFDHIPDVSMKEMVKQITMVVPDRELAIEFIEEKAEFRYGQVNQGLAKAMGDVMDDYMVMVCDLEMMLLNNNLTWHKLLYNLLPMNKVMKVLASVATAINEAAVIGGEVLTLLHELTLEANGDKVAEDLLQTLTEKACVPYMKILKRWIYEGTILDPCGEFLVQDNEKMKREESEEFYCSDYWSRKYTLTKTPPFLKQVSVQILRTGKYLNVLRQCGENRKCAKEEELEYSSENERYLETIDKTYKFASNALLDVFKGKDLKGRLRSVKRYFMLEQGDLIVTLMDLYEGQLSKPTKEIEPARLCSLLELALRTTQANCDPYKDNLTATLVPISLNQQMLDILSIQDSSIREHNFSPFSQYEDMDLVGWESFCLVYQVDWPVSLVLNANIMLRYQMIFRHLFFTKHVEKLLCEVWKSNKVVKLFPPQESRMYAPAFMLRQRMLNFVQHLEYYMMVEVVERNWNTFLEKLETVSNLDEVLTYHHDFLNQCLTSCMLLNAELLALVTKILQACVDFTVFIQKMKKYFVEAELGASLHVQESEDRESPEAQSEPCPSESFEQNIARFDLKFNANLLHLLSKVAHIKKGDVLEPLHNILYRLDLNGFYKAQLDMSYNVPMNSDE